LAQNDVPIVHCPRSNARLKNNHAPWERLRALGIKTGLGTDSLASCEDLDLLAEARFAIKAQRERNPNSTFNARNALERITIESARCLNMSQQIGSIEIGKQADLAIFRFDKHRLTASSINIDDPYELLIYGDCVLAELIVNGLSVYKNREHSAGDAGVL
jgi:cytosine/adenosine deaminase-related metal-dependent hydrolase